MGGKKLFLSLKCRNAVWRLQSLVQSRHGQPHYTNYFNSLPLWVDGMQNTQWVELLRSLPTVEDLWISEGLALWLGPALEELDEERATEVLAVLQNLFVERFVPMGGALHKFVAARRLSSLPIAFRHWLGDVV
jgi:hypothetical protein